MSFEIRPLTAANAGEYLSLLRQGVEEQPTVFRISPEDVTGAPFLSAPEGDFTLGAFATQGELRGIVSFARETSAKRRHKGLIFRMYVAPNAAGRGVGRRLLRECLARARQLSGLEQVNLTVVASNDRAKRLYASEGFESFSCEPCALKIDGVAYDEEQMAVRLDGTE